MTQTGIIDIHSHILPGLDDGSRSLEESMEMARIAYEEGIRAIIATPHAMPEGRWTPRERIEEGARLLQEEIKTAGWEMEIYPGNEVYFHEEALELLEEGKLLTLAGSDCVLIEFSPMSDARYIRNAFNRVMCLGLVPVLAHAERYESLMKQAGEQVRSLKEMGALIQVNANTIEGKCGRGSQKKALELLKSGLVDFIGTDAHGADRRTPRLKGCIETLWRKCPEEYIDRLLCGNARRYLL